MNRFRRPKIMGILNCTPDSFYKQSRAGQCHTALEIARSMVSEGADILDIGGESTRPGSDPVSDSEQIARTRHIIHALSQDIGIPISIDTQSAGVAEAALNAGAGIINDISGLRRDPNMAGLAAERGVPIVLMHMKGSPKTMQENPGYSDVLSEVSCRLQGSVDLALSAGIREENIILDPGIGFGKRLEDNLALLAKPSEWRVGDFPILVGLSRKSFLEAVASPERETVHSQFVKDNSLSQPEGRLAASLAAHAWCLQWNVDILRVHDVRETVQLVRTWEALSWAL